MSSSVPFVESEPFQQEGPPYQQPVLSGPVPLAPKPSGSLNINVTANDNLAPFPIPPVTTPGIDGRPYGFVDATGHPLSAVSEPPVMLSYPFNVRSDTVDLSHIPEPNRNTYPAQDVFSYNFEAPRNVKEELRIIPPSTSTGVKPVEWSAALNGKFAHLDKARLILTAVFKCHHPIIIRTPLLPIGLRHQCQAQDCHRLGPLVAMCNSHHGVIENTNQPHSSLSNTQIIGVIQFTL